MKEIKLFEAKQQKISSKFVTWMKQLKLIALKLTEPNYSDEILILNFDPYVPFSV